MIYAWGCGHMTGAHWCGVTHERRDDLVSAPERRKRRECAVVDGAGFLGAREYGPAPGGSIP